MKKITAFLYVSADGFFAGPNAEIDWFKLIKQDAEWDEYTHKQSQSNNTLIFGHTTYDLMKSFWPTPEAIKTDPGMAAVMNNNPKIVFSKKLQSVKEEPNWKNIRLLHDIKPEEILKLKEENDMTILGSGSIIQQFINLRLINEFALGLVPLILGDGKPLFKNVKTTNLDLLEERAFKNKLVLLRYQIAKE
jgi:dihydrofolate reductase